MGRGKAVIPCWEFSYTEVGGMYRVEGGSTGVSAATRVMRPFPAGCHPSLQPLSLPSQLPLMPPYGWVLGAAGHPQAPSFRMYSVILGAGYLRDRPSLPCLEQFLCSLGRGQKRSWQSMCREILRERCI